MLLDPQGRPSPWLAAELPSQENGSWVVNSDGTMRTTWKIRPNAKWHDGQPVRPTDFAFAEGGYEVAFGPWSYLEPGCEPIIREQALDSLREVATVHLHDTPP